jgi:hypothetical protein
LTSKTTLLLAGLLAAWIASCNSGIERTSYRGGNDYFPLLEGRVLSYRQTIEGETKDYTMSLHYIGGRAWKVYEAKIEGLAFGGLEFNSNGVVVEATSQFSYTSLEPRDEVSAFRQVWLDTGAREDSLWYDAAPGTESVFAGYQSVTVPAGSFENCMMIIATPVAEIKDSIEARHARGKSSDVLYQKELEVWNWSTVRWFAQGVGLVKEEIGPPGGVSIRRELLAVTSEGHGLVDSLHLPNTDEE